MFDRICIVGVGLIGGSVALAARQKGLCREIVGVDRDRSNLVDARNFGVIDQGFESVHALQGSFDLVMLATPVGSVGALFEQLNRNWSSSTVYTDAGSTKENVIQAAKSVFGVVPRNFVPGHPIAGSEQSGVAAATADLYENRRVILTPVAETDREATALVAAFWEKIGARASTMDPAHHDDILAATSHLPHVLAFSLADMLGKKDEKDEILQYAAGGFRDFTRLASSDPTMWLDICLANRTRIMRLIEEFREELTQFNEILEKNQAEGLFELFQSANNARRRFLEHFVIE
ncbi:MAG: prephenate dehydrogenase [Gammaproteobacteria bacterium]